MGLCGRVGPGYESRGKNVKEAEVTLGRGLLGDKDNNEQGREVKIAIAKQKERGF